MKTSEAPLISVIIPAYNAEKYVAKCLESIQNNTYKNLEIIVINDGSKDNTQSVVESFMEDKRIVLVNVENGGVSKARNTGIDRATGEYIAFVDSDDYIREDYFEKLVRPCIEEGADSGCCVYQKVDGEGNFLSDTRKEFFEDLLVTPKQIADNYFDYYDMGFVNFVFRVYKKSVIGETRFSETLKWGEDGSFNLELFKKSNKVFVSYEKLYYYVIHGGQATAKKMPGYCGMMIQHLGDIDSYLASYDAYCFENIRSHMGRTCLEVLIECAFHSGSLKAYKKEFGDYLAAPWCKYIKEAKDMPLRWKVMRICALHKCHRMVYVATKAHRLYIKIKRKLKNK